jgi:hypothetical protein
LGRGSTGPVQDHVFSIASAPLRDNGLVARPDPEAPIVHAFVESMQKVLLEELDHSLAATRPSWSRVWP